MATTTPPPGSSAGARWTAGLGAFLLVAAAATFVTVRWEQIPDGAKFGALVAVTGACLLAGLRLRAGLPITASALFHLGVLLVPIDVAALGVRAGWEWPRMLLAQGLTATVVFGAAAVAERSVVLRWAATGGVVVLAAGVGAVTTLPAALVLAGVALVAVAVAPRTPAPPVAEVAGAAWALLAGFAGPLAAADTAALPFGGTLTDLGLVGERAPAASAAATGLVAGLALGLAGARRRQLGLVLAGLASALVGAGTTWSGTEPAGDSSFLALALLLLAAQVAHRLVGHDPFWGRLTAVVAEVGHAVAVPVTLGLAGAVVLAPALDPEPSPLWATAALVIAATWLAAGPRHAVPRSVTAVAVSVAAAAVLFSGDGDRVAPVALAALGAAAVLLAPRLTERSAAADQRLAVLLVTVAPLVALEEPGPALAVGALGSLVLAAAAVAASRPARRAMGAGELVAAAVVPATVGAAVLAAHQGDWWPAGPVLVAVAWVAALVLDRARQEPGGEPLSAIPRAGMVAVLVTGLWLTPIEAAGLAALVAVLLLVDALRLPEPMALVGVGAAVPMVVGGLALDAGWPTGGTGIAVTAGSLAWLGLAGRLPGRWAPPALVNAVVTAAAGLVLASADTTTFSADLVLVGLAVAAAGLVVGHVDVAVAGAGLATFGTWGLLADADVTAADAYVAPVAALLLLLGLMTRRETHLTASAVPGAPEASADLGGPGGPGGPWGVGASGSPEGSGTSGPMGPSGPSAGSWGSGGSGGPWGSGGAGAPWGSDAPGSLGVPVSSWATVAPSVVLLGGAALVERWAGGSAGHAAVAGAVGAAAVVAGALWRLAGPLLTGTVLVVAVTIHETLGVTAGLPTWVWLASGGTALLAAGIAMERHGVGPIETGRRLVDVVADRFE